MTKKKTSTGPASWARVAGVVSVEDRPRPPLTRLLVERAVAMGALVKREAARLVLVFPSTHRVPVRDLNQAVLDREEGLQWAGAICQDGHTHFFLLSLKFFDPAERRWFNVPPLRGLGPRAAKALIETLKLGLEVPDLPPAREPHKQSVP